MWLPAGEISSGPGNRNGVDGAGQFVPTVRKRQPAPCNGTLTGTGRCARRRGSSVGRRPGHLRSGPCASRGPEGTSIGVALVTSGGGAAGRCRNADLPAGGSPIDRYSEPSSGSVGGDVGRKPSTHRWAPLVGCTVLVACPNAGCPPGQANAAATVCTVNSRLKQRCLAWWDHPEDLAFRIRSADDPTGVHGFVHKRVSDIDLSEGNCQGAVRADDRCGGDRAENGR